LKFIFLCDQSDIRPTPFIPRLGKYLKIKNEYNFKESLRDLIKELEKKY